MIKLHQRPRSNSNHSICFIGYHFLSMFIYFLYISIINKAAIMAQGHNSESTNFTNNYIPVKKFCSIPWTLNWNCSQICLLRIMNSTLKLFTIISTQNYEPYTGIIHNSFYSKLWTLYWNNSQFFLLKIVNSTLK